jgi:cytochrome c554/c'-like protein
MLSLKRVLSVVLLVAMAGAVGGLTARAAPFNQGEAKCDNCHKAEDAVWKKTKHATSFREIHRKPAVKGIIAAAGGDANMRRNEVCTTCHYTMVSAGPGKPPTAGTGTSCEGCHGASSDWLPLHNSTAPKPERVKKTMEAGMVRPENLYDIAQNCLGCHELARPGIAPETFAKMIDAGHPAGTDFELVSHLEGTVRHRFYPPDTSKNKEMTEPEKARVFIVGHAAALVRETEAQGKVKNAKYEETLKKIDTDARKALDAIKGQVPEAAAVLAQPTDANARKLVDAIANKDLTPQVGKLLPPKNTYK